MLWLCMVHEVDYVHKGMLFYTCCIYVIFYTSYALFKCQMKTRISIKFAPRDPGIPSLTLMLFFPN
jgi:hypothetical protein